jgi:hypothetical protein
MKVFLHIEYQCDAEVFAVKINPMEVMYQAFNDAYSADECCSTTAVKPLPPTTPESQTVPHILGKMSSDRS